MGELSAEVVVVVIVVVVVVTESRRGCSPMLMPFLARSGELGVGELEVGTRAWLMEEKDPVDGRVGSWEVEGGTWDWS